MRKSPSQAYSLIELLVVIAVVSILIAITLPALRHIKNRSYDSESATRMRTHSQVVQLYAQDYRNNAPFLADPFASYSIARGGGLTISYEFFETVEVWGVALVDSYYGFGLGSEQWDENIQWGVFARPGPNGLLYQYSPTFFAASEYWNVDTRDSGQLRPVKLSAVRYPSSKALFLELDEERSFPIWSDRSLRKNPGWAFAFSDGSVRRPDARKLVEPCPLGEGNAMGGRFTFGVVGLHTQDGILGRDVE